MPSSWGMLILVFFFFKQKTAYELRISDWSSDVCSSDLKPPETAERARRSRHQPESLAPECAIGLWRLSTAGARHPVDRIFEHRRDRAIMFGTGEDDSPVAAKHRLARERFGHLLDRPRPRAEQRQRTTEDHNTGRP